MSDDKKPDPVPQQVIDDCEVALKRAKITLMMGSNTVFYTTILMSMTHIIDETIQPPTACTDGKRLYLHPQFFMDLDPNQRVSLLCHEILHVALDHMHRRGHRDPLTWNYAADYVINGFLIEAGYIMPDKALHDKKYDDLTSEEVYKILEKKSDQQLAGIGGQNGLGNDVIYPENAAPGDKVSQNDVTETILRAATAAKQAKQPPGSVPGEVEIALDKQLSPPLPWHVILQNYMTEFNKDDFTFRRPNRRFLPDQYMPTAFGESVTNISIAVDASCSVTQKEFAVFISKIVEILEVMKPKETTVISFDTKVGKTQTLLPGDNPLTKLKFKGRGGTSIGPVHKWAKENQPTLMLVFTDGEFRQTKPDDPRIPVIWLINNDPKWVPETGVAVHYDIER